MKFSKLTLLALIVSTPALAQQPLQAFRAQFDVEWKGMTAGQSVLELAPGPNGRYTYQSRNTAKGIFRLALPDEIDQVSTMETQAGSIRPLSFRGEDSGRSNDDAVRLDFDWMTKQLRGRAAGENIELPLPLGTQDPLSSQIALMLELSAGKSPSKFTIADKGKLKDYLYRRDGEATLNTPFGKVGTVIWRSERAESDRVTRVWYAPSLGYTPLQAERRRGGKLEFTLKLTKLERPIGVQVRGNVTPR
jgi:hypothetical protein